MDQFEEFVAIASVNSVKFGLVFFGFVCSVSIVHAISLNDTLATKLLSATMTLFYVALALFMFGLSVPTFLYGVGQRNLEFVPKEFLQVIISEEYMFYFPEPH